MALRYLALGLALALAAASAQAQSYRCVGKDGKKYYGSTIPHACLGMPIEQISAQGTVLRRIDPAGDEKMRAAKEAEAAKKREDDALAREEGRRNRALLATYTSEKDIEQARARALADNNKSVREVEGRIAEIKKRQAGYNKEMEFYREAPGADKAKGKPAAAKGAKPPPKLAEDIRMADIDLKLQEEALATRRKQVETINARYDEDKKRYLELTKPR